MDINIESEENLSSYGYSDIENNIVISRKFRLRDHLYKGWLPKNYTNLDIEKDLDDILCQDELIKPWISPNEK